jgi:hypothetical protein
MKTASKNQNEAEASISVRRYRTLVVRKPLTEQQQRRIVGGDDGVDTLVNSTSAATIITFTGGS